MLSNKLVEEALQLGDRLLHLAEEGDGACTEDSCLILFSVVRDCGYKIRSEVLRCRTTLSAKEADGCRADEPRA